MQIRDASPQQFEAVLRDSHATWGAGMSLEDYLALNLALRSTAWGREHYRFLVGLEDEGEIASSMKLYTLRGELDGRPILIAGVGAVFTPPARRGRGQAAGLIEAVLAGARVRAHDVALLLSEIGGAYYERLGFRALPAQEAACMAFLPVPWPKEPAWVGHGRDPMQEVAGLRPWRTEDLESLRAIHEEASRGQRFRLLRDRARWDHLLLQGDLETRLRRDGPDHRWAVERDGAVQAYAVLKEGRGRLLWKEHGSRLGAEDLLVELFWAALALARRLGMGRIDAWQLPAAVTSGPLYPIARRPRRDPVPMLRSLEDAPAPSLSAAEECRISWLDAF